MRLISFDDKNQDSLNEGRYMNRPKFSDIPSDLKSAARKIERENQSNADHTGKIYLITYKEQGTSREVQAVEEKEYNEGIHGSIQAVIVGEPILQKARQLGREAYEEGKPPAPALNRELTAMISGPIGGSSVKIMQAYTDGWTEANLSKPFPESSEDVGGQSQELLTEAVPQWVKDSLAIIGGNRGLFMIGAKDLTFDEATKTIKMRIGRNSSGANLFEIKLDVGRDLYDVSLHQVRVSTSGVADKVKAEASGLYADQVGPWFEEETGMRLSLGTMGESRETLTEQTEISDETLDDAFDNIVRKLIVLGSIDALQDVDFDESTGSIYLFLDAQMGQEEAHRIQETINGMYQGTMIAASPSGVIPENSQPADWWVIFVPQESVEGAMGAPQSQTWGVEQPMPTVATQAPTTGAAVQAIAQGVDVGKAIDALVKGESIEVKDQIKSLREWEITPSGPLKGGKVGIFRFSTSKDAMAFEVAVERLIAGNEMAGIYRKDAFTRSVELPPELASLTDEVQELAKEYKGHFWESTDGKGENIELKEEFDPSKALKKGEGDFDTEETPTGVRFVFKVRGKTFVSTPVDKNLVRSHEKQVKDELRLAAHQYFTTGKISQMLTQISVQEAITEVKFKVGNFLEVTHRYDDLWPGRVGEVTAVYADKYGNEKVDLFLGTNLTGQKLTYKGFPANSGKKTSGPIPTPKESLDAVEKNTLEEETIYTDDPFAKELARIAFPDYKGKHFEIEVTDRPIDVRSYWDEGARSFFRFVDLATKRVSPEVPQQSAFDQPIQGADAITLKPGMVCVEHHIGRYTYIRIHVRPENVSKLLPAPQEDLPWAELVVLVATRSMKPSYAGISNYRFVRAHEITKISQEEWDAAKESLIRKGLLNRAGAVTTKGRNAVPYNKYSDLDSIGEKKMESRITEGAMKQVLDDLIMDVADNMVKAGESPDDEALYALIMRDSNEFFAQYKKYIPTKYHQFFKG